MRAALVAVAPVLVASDARAGNPVPQFDHVVIVIEENHAYAQVIGSASAPYINSLEYRKSKRMTFRAVPVLQGDRRPSSAMWLVGSSLGGVFEGCFWPPVVQWRPDP